MLRIPNFSDPKLDDCSINRDKLYCLNDDGMIPCQSDENCPPPLVDVSARHASRFLCSGETCSEDVVNVFCDTCEGKKVDAECQYMEKCRQACKTDSYGAVCKECALDNRDLWNCCFSGRNGNSDVCNSQIHHIKYNQSYPPPPCGFAAWPLQLTSPLAGQSNK